MIESPSVIGDSTPEDLSTAQLVAGSLEGDADSMQTLLARYQHRVFGLCFRMLGNRMDAEDATQETFIRVFRSLHHWDSSRDFVPWLFAIAGNRCRTLLSKRSRQPRSQLIEEMLDGETGQEPDGDLAEEIQLALAELPENQRIAFVLFHEQQLSYIEIAETLSSPVGTIKTWIHRARLATARWLVRRHPELDPSNAMYSV